MRHDIVTSMPSIQTATLPEENRALLEQYLAEPQEALLSELIQRLAPMVYGVCHRQLGIGADADDAFQATFLVVVRRLKDLATKNNLAGWVHGIAFRVARKARQLSIQRSKRLHTFASNARLGNSQDANVDLKEVIDAEVARLPAPYREAVALCELQEKTLDEAAKELGWPVGTVAGRLSRARAMLKSRLARHGFSAVALAACLQGAAAAAPATALLDRTIQSACLEAKSLATGALVSPHVAALAQSYTAPFLVAKTLIFSLVITIGVVLSGWYLISSLMISARNLQAVIAGNSRFAVEAYQRMRLKQPHADLLFSPFSLSTSICLLALGTEGNTESEILRTLHLPSREVAHRGMAQLQRDLRHSLSPGSQLKITNALFGDPEMPWLEKYLMESELRYGAPLIPVSYKNRKDTANTINRWGMENTGNLIQQMVQEGIVDVRTCISFINALSLESQWQSPFHASQTVRGPFYTAQGKVPVTMMRGSTADGLHYAETPSAHVVSLRFVEAGKMSDIHMTCVIPKDINGLIALEKQISVEQMETWAAMSKQKSPLVSIAMPRLSLCTTTHWRGPLEAMGMKSCFVPQYAEFTRMLQGGQQLRLNHKNQRTKLEWNENGCRAASIGFDEILVSEPAPPRPIDNSLQPMKEDIIMDRPFFFFIRHHSTGTILFMGAVLTAGSN